MSKYPINKNAHKREDKFVSEKGQFEIHKDGKKISNEDVLKLIKTKKD